MHIAWSKNNAWDAQDARQKNHTHWVHIVHARQDCSGGVEQRERYETPARLLQSRAGMELCFKRHWPES